MPVIIPRDLPAYEVLLKEGANVIDSASNINSDVRVINIAIVNLMPTKQATETQLLRLVANCGIHVKVTLVCTATYTPTHVSREYLDKFYKRFDEIEDKKFDGLIITGAPVENMPFESVKYWQEFERIVEFSKTNVNNTLFICWGAQAGLYSLYGIEKRPLDSKLFGIFKAYATKEDEPLLDGIGDDFYIPNSRHTTIIEDNINSYVSVLARTKEGGVAIARSFDSKCFFLTGHSEYDKFTLKDEYLRDLSKGLPIKKPVNYFIDDNNLDDVDMKWQRTANHIFTNWIKYYVVK